MKSEVMGVRTGEVTIREIRKAVGVTTRAGATVGVFVLSSSGDAPFIGQVLVGEGQRGRSMHLTLVCPRCEAGKRSLFVGRANELGCRRCLHRLTRHQAERTLRSWRRCGGREEDQLQRLVRRGGLTSAGLSLAQALADELLEGDRDRVAALVNNGTAALIATERAK
jgi:late competence protein required for DNA uptake (superfamily II DNA/RNA helicase)